MTSSKFHLAMWLGNEQLKCTNADMKILQCIRIVYKNTDEWYNKWQGMTTSGTTSDNERRRVTILPNLSFFQIREEPTTKHPKENNL